MGAQTTIDESGTGACVVCAKTDHGGSGWLGEVGVGYDYQIGDKVVIGALFNYDFSDVKGRSTMGFGGNGKTNNDSTWFVGARAGWLMTPEVLNYWSVGYTQTHFGGASLSATGGPGRPAGSPGGLRRRRLVPRRRPRSGDARRLVLAQRSPLCRLQQGGASETAAGRPVCNLNFDPVVETATSEIVYKFNWGH